MGRQTRILKRSALRRRAVLRGALPLLALALLVVPLSLGTALAADQTLYLMSTGVPISFLGDGYPTATDLPNYDPGRDGEPGLLLRQSSNPNSETDPDKYQLWMAAATGVEVDGNVTFRFWSAMKDFDPSKKGSVRVQLLDCDLFLTDCNLIATEVKNSNPWSGGSADWVEHTLNLGHIEHDIPFGRSLAVKVVVRDSSDDDMWFAYNTTSYPSSLTIGTGPPPTTTTTSTTTTTTTTTVPPATTTTTAPPATTTTTAPPATTTTTVPPTTTTAPPVTTTTQPVYATTTTTLPPTTWPPHLTTTTTTPATPAATTTTTAPPPGTTAAPTTSTTAPPPATTVPPAPPASSTTVEPEAEDIALAALPAGDDANRDGPRVGGGFSSTLIDGLALIVPPGVAAAILSPLLLLEALISTFAGTGRELLVPLVVLVVGVAWIGGRRRHEPTPAFVPWYEKASHE